MIIKNKTIEDNLKDYKIMCFDGKAKCSFVCTERKSQEGLAVDFFDLSWNHLPFKRHYRNSNYEIKKPNGYSKMIELAEILSKNIKFLRVDFYEIDNKVYFGELTFYPGSGFEEFDPFEYDYKLGSLISLNAKE